MKILKYPLFLSVILLVGCTEYSEHVPDSKFKLVHHSEFEFPLNDSTDYQSFYVDLVNIGEDEQRLVFLGKNNTLYFFDLKSKEVTKSIKVIEDGPTPLRKLWGLYFHTMDSIYVVAASSYRVGLIDRKGEVLRTYNLLKSDSWNENTGLIYANSTSQPILSEDQLYFTVFPDRNPNEKFLFEAHTASRLNLTNETYDYFSNYPSSMRDAAWGVHAARPYSTFNESTKNIIFSFAKSDSLYCYHLETEETKAIYAGTHAENKNINTPKKNPSNDVMFHYAVNHTSYGPVIYDKFRSIYYRIVYHPLKNMEGINPTDVTYYDYLKRPFSIITFDQEFNFLGETYFDGKLYFTNNYFVSEDGLCLSKSNPNNESQSEDLLSFDCFQLAEIDE
ncbi:MAG: DUF4221 domain-containing protein [Cyclobacteriaceae bacterium]|nr:DUF4221 family protein [Cyclobacteriaceae bacterium]MCH8515880.1 DUF4221 domain-containing protein [Cyclobacteriaceae bacterium]